MVTGLLQQQDRSRGLCWLNNSGGDETEQLVAAHFNELSNNKIKFQCRDIHLFPAGSRPAVPQL